MMERLEDHLRRKSAGYVAAASLLYFAVTSLIAHIRPLWYDELFTFHVARQARTADVLRALAAGADIHPPLDYLLRHYSMRLFGSGELADRLPSILAFWIVCLALRRIVAYRCGEIFGLVAFLAPLSTLAYAYSYEGRGYALMLTGGSVALAAWQAAADGRCRPVSLALMALGLSVAVTVHYYGLFVFIPLVGGEVARAWSRRRVDWPLTLVAAGSALSFLVNTPYLIAQAAQTGTFWSKPSLAEALQSYWWLLSDLAPVIPLFLALAAFACALDRARGRERRAEAVVPFREWSAAVAALFVPAACYVVARLGTGVFNFRYMLVTILGVVLAGAFLASQIFADSASLRLALVAALALVGAYQMVKAERESDHPNTGRMRQAAIENALPDNDLPVVHGTRTSFMEATRYADPALYPRMFYLTSREASLKWVGNDNGQWAMTNISPLVPGRVMEYRTFLEQHRRILLVNPRLAMDWLLPQLLDDGARVIYRTISGENVVLEVQMPPAS